VTNAKNLGLPDMSFREIAIFVPLIAWSVWIGVYPKPYFDVLRRPVAEIVQRVRPEYYAAQEADHERRWSAPLVLAKAGGAR
jgi:NADH-quinone oxidoreductase subunit M